MSDGIPSNLKKTPPKAVKAAIKAAQEELGETFREAATQVGVREKSQPPNAAGKFDAPEAVKVTPQEQQIEKSRQMARMAQVQEELRQEMQKSAALEQQRRQAQQQQPKAATPPVAEPSGKQTKARMLAQVGRGIKGKISQLQRRSETRQAPSG